MKKFPLLIFCIVPVAALCLVACDDQLLPGSPVPGHGGSVKIVYTKISNTDIWAHTSHVFSVPPDGAREQLLAEGMVALAAAGNTVVALSGGNTVNIVTVGSHSVIGLRTIVASNAEVEPSSLAVSPAGDKITYTTVASTRSTIIADSDGGSAVQIPLAVAHSATPAFSPDGSQLAFMKATDTGSRNSRYIYVVNTDGTGLRMVANLPTDAAGTLSTIAWSPDGTTLAVTLAINAATYGMFLVYIDKYWLYVGEGFSPAWSPDGKKIAYTYTTTVDSDKNIYVADVEGTFETRAVTQSASGRAGSNLYARWSPDGTELLYVHVQDTIRETPGTLMLLDLESGEDVPLADSVYRGFWIQ